MILLQLFVSFFQVGLFTIGGGYAALPLIQQQIVDIHGWLTLKEFADVVTISQMTPGPIGINAATFVGTKMGGLWGAVAAPVGCVPPSVIIVLILAHIYLKYRDLSLIKGILGGLRPATVALIASAGLSIIATSFFGTKLSQIVFANIDPVAVIVFAAGLTVLRIFKKTDPILIILGAGALGLGLYSLMG